MNTRDIIIICTLCACCLWSCKEEDPISSCSRNNYNPNPVSIDYYPQGRNYKWTYDWEEITGSDTVRLISYDTYNYYHGWIEGRGRFPYTGQDGQPSTSGLIGLGGNFIVANFDITGAVDSILLDTFVIGDPKTNKGSSWRSYQFPIATYVTESKNYSKIPCKKSLVHIMQSDSNINTWTYSWYGKNEGLIKEVSRKYEYGKLTTGYTKILIETNF